ncbi:MAG: hypothetical protein ABEL51_16440 [Salinibacter sp.]
MGTETSSSDRKWIKVGDDPLRYEYGRENDHPEAPAVEGQLAYVEEEKRSSYFHWETYTTHENGAAPSRREAQDRALRVLKEEGAV